MPGLKKVILRLLLKMVPDLFFPKGRRVKESGFVGF